ncbi:MAG: phosphonate ABC transporter, permease protein PhnE [Thioclava sp.]|nr:phosphonate ABC transporter, permease protein PhnE [Thioclava sp.]
MNNLANVATRSAFIAIIAVGATFVISSGDLDLSVDSMVAFVASLMILFLNSGAVADPSLLLAAAVALAVVIGALCGLASGLITTVGRIEPFIATLGTIGGVIMAVPVAFFAARNTTPSATFLRPIALFIIVASRSINSLIWALLLVAIIGPGLLAGIVAIALRSIGFIGKLLYEAIEETDATQIEAIEATGASGAQVLSYGIVPQIMPAFWGIIVFRWDINIRESTILGLVGAGGIGLKLQASLNTLAWSQVTVILLLILATVVLSEWVSARMRHAII